MLRQVLAPSRVCTSAKMRESTSLGLSRTSSFLNDAICSLINSYLSSRESLLSFAKVYSLVVVSSYFSISSKSSRCYSGFELCS